MEEREEGMGVQDEGCLSSIWGWGMWGDKLLLLLLQSSPFEPCLELFWWDRTRGAGQLRSSLAIC